MHSPAELLDIFEKALAREKIIKRPQNLYDPVNYILSLGGKRIRPVMALMACDMFGGDVEKAIPAALGIEMFHNFSLVHDDIMDRAPLRRGHQTVHEKWDPNTAILSGDTMLVLAYEYLLRLEEQLSIPVIRIFSQTAKEVCEGQQYDMEFETAGEVSINDYLEMIRLKTAVLIGASFEIGSLIGGAVNEEMELIYEFGTNAGMAFQLMDDLLDTYGDEAKFGKKQYGDIHTNKKTYLYLKALELADAGQEDILIRYYVHEGLDPDEKVEQILRIFERLDVRGHTGQLIKHYHDRAVQCLEEIKLDEGRKRIISDYTEKLMARTY